MLPCVGNEQVTKRPVGADGKKHKTVPAHILQTVIFDYLCGCSVAVFVNQQTHERMRLWDRCAKGEISINELNSLMPSRYSDAKAEGGNQKNSFSAS
jgi:hypothetical protein